MNEIPGLVITFEPPPTIVSRLHLLLGQLEPLFVVDNGSSPEIRRLLAREAAENPSLLVRFNDRNLGVASALNLGFQWAIERGHDRLIALDQDSLPAPGMIRELLTVYDLQPNRGGLAVVAPNVIDPGADVNALYLRPRGGIFFERVPCRRGVLDNVSIIITSGSLNNLAAYQKIGPFRDDFFIDYVDTEYCLRAIQHGYKIVVACNATLHHRLGDQEKRQIGSLTLRPTFHSPLRWYYINRNRIAMFGLYAFRAPYWAIYDFLVAVYAFLKMLLYEDQKLKKTLAVLLGIWDGLLHRMGPIVPSYKRWLVND